MRSVANKKILLTGADGALGRVAAEHFLKRGFDLVCSCHSGAGQKTLEGYLKERLPQLPLIVVSDLGKESEVKSLVQKAKDHLKVIDVLINTAGGFRWTMTEDASEQDFDFLINANVKSSWLLAKSLLPMWKVAGQGQMIFISAKASLAPSDKGMGLYCASKAAMNAMLQGMAQEVKNTKIKINALAPSIIDTEVNRRDMPDADHSKWVKPEEIISMMEVLLSESSSSVHGAIIPLAGRV